MCPLHIPFTQLTPVFVEHIIPLLDKDFNPFDSETSDIEALDDDEDIRSQLYTSNGHKLEHCNKLEDIR